VTTLSLQSMQVLLLDDSAPMRAIVTEVLRAAGVERVVDTESPGAAWTLMRQHAFDVAIIDYNMQPMNGLEFTRRVRTDPASPCPHLPIIMMTGHAERSRVVQARDAGVSEFVVKPVNAKVLMERLYAVVLKPRAFVRDETFVGPCRRRARRPDFEGPFRRRTDPKGMVEV
jgi:CheY-like chemotaxis protein